MTSPAYFRSVYGLRSKQSGAYASRGLHIGGMIKASHGGAAGSKSTSESPRTLIKAALQNALVFLLMVRKWEIMDKNREDGQHFSPVGLKS